MNLARAFLNLLATYALAVVLIAAPMAAFFIGA